MNNNDQRPILISEFILSYKRIRKMGNRCTLKILESMAFEVENKIKELKVTMDEVLSINNDNVTNDDKNKFIEAFHPYLL